MIDLNGVLPSIWETFPDISQYSRRSEKSLYAIGNWEDGLPVKIGRAKQPSLRLKDFGSGNHRDLCVLSSIQFAGDFEKPVHDFMKSQGKHVRGEWFQSDKFVRFWIDGWLWGDVPYGHGFRDFWRSKKWSPHSMWRTELARWGYRPFPLQTSIDESCDHTLLVSDIPPSGRCVNEMPVIHHMVIRPDDEESFIRLSDHSYGISAGSWEHGWLSEQIAAACPSNECQQFDYFCDCDQGEIFCLTSSGYLPLPGSGLNARCSMRLAA